MASPFCKVQIQHEDTNFDAYVTGKENAPGIVVLQEWWGVDAEIKNHAVHISQIGEGYRTLIPDLYHGKVGLDAAEAQHLVEGLDWQGAVRVIQSSVKWLKANGSSKVGVAGYCLGGALSIASAVLVPEVDAAIAFYGTPPNGLADASKAMAPIQAHFAEHDIYFDFSVARSLEEKLRASGVVHEVHLYPGCGHAFMNTSAEGLKRRNETTLTDHNKAAIELAWSRFAAWMARFLGPSA